MLLEYGLCRVVIGWDLESVEGSEAARLKSRCLGCGPQSQFDRSDARFHPANLESIVIETHNARKFSHVVQHREETLADSYRCPESRSAAGGSLAQAFRACREKPKGPLQSRPIMRSPYPRF